MQLAAKVRNPPIVTNAALRHPVRDSRILFADSAFDFRSIQPNETGVEMQFRHTKNSLRINGLQTLHQNGAFIRSGEYRPAESASGPTGTLAGE